MARPAAVGLLLAAVLGTILVSNLLPAPEFTLEAGDTAPEDILAPQNITYVSEVLTERARQEARTNVRDAYDPPDMRVARSQVNRTRLVLDFLETIRADSLADRELQIDYIGAIPELDLPRETLDTLLDLTASEWETVRQDTLTAVDQAMREQIREDRLDEARAAVPLLVRLELPEEQATVVTALAQQLIVPNSSYNPQLTEQRRQEAENSVAPVQQSFDINSTIVYQGDTVDEADIEAMQRLGLMQAEADWRDSISLVVAAVLIVALLGLYVQRLHPEFFASGRHMMLLSLQLVLFAFTAKLIVPGRAVVPFLFPAAGLSMLLTVLFDPNLAIMVSLCVAAVVGVISENSLELAVYTAAGGIISALVIRKSARISTFFRAGIVVGVANASVVLIFRLGGSDLLGILQLIGAGLINGLFSAALTVLGFYVVGNVFNVVTSLQLQELARLDHPLLQELLRKAPGTYHHSLMVANLAEQAAQRIGADSEMVRVGSFYHDVGKIARPYFFTENQNGSNAHARLDPHTSAQAITNHVKDGLDLARRYRLPERIRAFIPEHQGTRLVSYFYHEAVEAAGDASQVEEEDYRYPGPKPQSRETALVLLADSCEAASTALQSRAEEEIERLVTSIVNEIVMEGELDESGLTLGDIQAVKESLTETLQGRFHDRPRYPGQEAADHPDTPPKEDDKARTRPGLSVAGSEEEE